MLLFPNKLTPVVDTSCDMFSHQIPLASNSCFWIYADFAIFSDIKPMVKRAYLNIFIVKDSVWDV